MIARISLLPAVLIAGLVLGGSLYVARPDAFRVERLRPAFAPAAPAVVVFDSLPAFPGAVGDGARALDGCRTRTMAVWKVTNTNDDGDGSFRAALDSVEVHAADRVNYIEFRTGGKIVLLSTIGPTGALSCTAILGQTAPGGGITIAGNRLRFDGDTRDFLMRNVRWFSQAASNFAINDAADVMIAYSSFGLSATSGGNHVCPFVSADTTDNSNEVFRVTLQNLLCYWADEAHSTLGGGQGSPETNPPCDTITEYRNVLIGPGSRMPLYNCHEVTVAQPVAYNWGGTGTANRGMETDNEVTNLQIRGAYAKHGPATDANGQGSVLLVMTDLCQNTTRGDGTCAHSAYLEDIRSTGNGFDSTHTADSLWAGPRHVVWCRDEAADAGSDAPCPVGDTVPTSWRLGSAPTLNEPTYQPSLGAISDALLTTILAEAGNALGVTCDGRLTRDVRDSWDQAQIDDIVAGTGLLLEVDIDTFTVPTPAAGTPCADSDNDDLWDAFETRIFGNLTTSDAPDSILPNNGYFLYEAMVHGFDPSATLEALLGAEAVSTYGGLYVYRSPAVVQDVIYLDALGLVTTAPGVDTVVVYTWSADSIPAGGVGLSCWEAGTARYFVTENALSGGNLLDSIEADTLLAQAGCSLEFLKDTARVPN